MQNALSAVKWALSLTCVMNLIPVFSSAAEFQSHPDYIALPLEFAPYDHLRTELEKADGLSLQNRGEAHVTLITPPEWKMLGEKLKMEEAEKIFHDQRLLKAKIHRLCIGRGQKSENGRTLETYFVVVRAPALIRFREKLEKLYHERGGRSEFSAKHFYPHVTLGFTDRDLHEQDGVVKDETSCLLAWKKL